MEACGKYCEKLVVLMMKDKTVILKNDIAELEKLSMVLEEVFEENGIAPGVLFQVNLALDELVTNIISYGYPDNSVHEVIIELSFTGNQLVVILSDDGVPFNPLEIPAADIDKSVEEREIGGLGMHFVRKTMDSIVYQRTDGRNILSLTKAVS